MHAFSCLFVFEKREPLQEAKPRLSDSLVKWWRSGIRASWRRGQKDRERVNDGGRESRRPLRDNSPGVGSFTDTGNA